MTAQPRYPFRFTAAQRRSAVRRWAKGERTAEIAADIGCHPRSIEIWAKAAGLTRDRQPPLRKHDEWTRATAIRLVMEEKRSSWYVADVVGDGVRPQTVRRWVRDAGGTQPAVKQLDHNECERVYLAHGITKAMEILGASKNGIYSAIRRAVRLRIRAEMQEAAQ